MEMRARGRDKGAAAAPPLATHASIGDGPFYFHAALPHIAATREASASFSLRSLLTAHKRSRCGMVLAISM